MGRVVETHYCTQKPDFGSDERVTKSRMSEIFAQPVANETKAMAIVPAKILGVRTRWSHGRWRHRRPGDF